MLTRDPVLYDRRIPSPPPNCVTLAEAATRAGVSESALRQRALRGKLPVVRVGGHVFVEQDVAEALATVYAILRGLAALTQREEGRERSHAVSPEAGEVAP